MSGPLEIAIQALLTAELALEPDADDAERAQAFREVSDALNALGRNDIEFHLRDKTR